jgi:hypothetical protein
MRWRGSAATAGLGEEVGRGFAALTLGHAVPGANVPSWREPLCRLRHRQDPAR